MRKGPAGSSSRIRRLPSSSFFNRRPRGNKNKLEGRSSSTDETSSPAAVCEEKDQAILEKETLSYRNLIVFTVTTILIWLSEPLLSLVDTTVVAMTASPRSAVLQIAALGPATTLFDSAIYITYFLAIATTNQVAPALAKKKWKELRTSTSHILGLSVVLGLMVSATILGGGHYMISKMVGATTTPEIVPLATTYAWIRSAVAPFCVVGFVAQSFCLACLDTKTPAVAVIVASIVNVIGDLLLSPIWGIQGAAVATALATVASCWILMKKVRSTTNEWKVFQDEEEEAQAEGVPDQETKNSTLLVSENSKVSDNSTSEISSPLTFKEPQDSDDVPFLSLPNKKATLDLFKLAGPIFFIMLVKIACYSLFTIKATAFDLVSLASHNIMMRVFFFYSCFGDSLGQAAQSFFPQVSKESRRELLKRLTIICIWVGFWNSQCATLILTRMGRFLTKDADIIRTVASHTKFLSLSVLIHPFIALFEGVILARRDLAFLTGAYALNTAAHFMHMYSPLVSTFDAVWRALVVYQGMRMVQLGIRIWQKERRKPELVLKATS